MNDAEKMGNVVKKERNERMSDKYKCTTNAICEINAAVCITKTKVRCVTDATAQVMFASVGDIHE